ncbi:iron transport multicopper oxidase FET3 [Arthroderma uncinatum]|uniref:iron transport multicopper oxidase FET3 n=1 Tax=Arthroderma uncinatum TaxID=74035 RepID=UPI00144A7FD7|nr:iron transport multicopper oxidase FET3 [Arthroderma uncinatum]KAF3482634.1 iron transport multicopper oxidase FET3 [Arthroderma uncinatum]
MQGALRPLANFACITLCVARIHRGIRREEVCLYNRGVYAQKAKVVTSIDFNFHDSVHIGWIPPHTCREGATGKVCMVEKSEQATGSIMISGLVTAAAEIQRLHADFHLVQAQKMEKMAMERPASRRRHNSQRRLQQSDDDDQHQDEDAGPSTAGTGGRPETETRRAPLIGLWPFVGLLCCISTLLVFLKLLGQWQQGSVANIAGVGVPLDTASPWSSLLHPEDHVFRGRTTVRLDWTITTDYRRLDGVRKRVYLINGMFPGPTIEARSGDRLNIHVVNNLEDEGVVLHWHGLHMRGANHMDGVPGVTQCPIVPGGSMLYNFTISDSQSGTFWYHAHSGLQRAEGLYGGLIVHKPSVPAIRAARNQLGQTDSLKYGYQQEHLLLIGDWYHRPAHEVLAWFQSSTSNGQEPVPDSLLINGAGKFNCSMAPPVRPLDCVDSGSLAGVSLGFEHGVINPIQVDGGTDVEQPSQTPNAHSIGIVYPGQRMDFVVHNVVGESTRSSMTVELDPECFNLPNPALTHIQTFPITDSSQQSKPNSPSKPLSDNPIGEPGRHVDLAELVSTPATTSQIPAQADQTFVVYTVLSKLSANRNAPYGFFNHTSWRPQADPPLPLIALEPKDWDKNQFAVRTSSEPAWVDLVVNNLDEGPHPFHIHGHDFYVLSLYEAETGFGSYNPWDLDDNPSSAPPYDYSKAILRDTVHIPARGHAVLRFRADNPGVWLFHCHILWHLASGMAMLVDVMNNGSRSLDLPSHTCSYLA